MKKTGLVAKIAAIGCASVVAVGCFGYGLAAAGGSSSPFGGTASSAPAAEVLVSNVSDTSVGSVLSQPASRDITQGVQAVEAEKEAERIAAEQAALAEEQARIQAAEQALAKARTTDASSAMSQLAEVDWSCGKDAFISEWANRINNYLAGSPLAGQGEDFRYRCMGKRRRSSLVAGYFQYRVHQGCKLLPAAQRVGLGLYRLELVEEAINAHVAGLAKGYGYTISYSNAQKYCPPNYDNWFRDTLREMSNNLT